jgi:hypothetical protein
MVVLFAAALLSVEPTATDGQTGAWVMAQMFLERDYLANSRTAYYGRVWDRWQNPAKCALQIAENRYSVSGWVECKGDDDRKYALQFHMKLEKIGADKWQIIKQPVFSKRPLSDGLSQAGIIDRSPALK